MAQPAALVTGGAAGIGKGIVLALAEKGYSLTVLDMNKGQLDAMVAELRAQVPSCAVQAIQVNVTDDGAQKAAFAKHMESFGRLDVSVLNAGIGEQGNVFGDLDATAWKLAVDVNLSAVVVGMRLSAYHMKKKHGGTIITVASASAIYPMALAPVYAASKAGVMQLTRSVAPLLSKSGIKITCICPEFVDTNLVKLIPEVVKSVSLLTPSHVAQAALKLIHPDSKAGTVLLIRQDGRVQEPFQNIPLSLGGLMRPGRATSSIKALAHVDEARRGALAAWAAGSLPQMYKKMQVHTLSSNFRAATRIVEVPLPVRPPPGQLLVRRVYVSINASDVNYSSGRYHKNKAEAQSQLPFDCGFDTVNVVAAVGAGVKDYKVGDPVATMTYDGFGDYALVPAKMCLRILDPTPETVALLTSGLTASIALEQCGHIQSGETVLVTAAAGGTGQFAVQLAKQAGCHVIATCGGPGKVAGLKALGADRVVDYKNEKLKDVLKKEYPKGVDVVFESVGGDMFAAALDGLAYKGRLIVIGMMSTYAEGWPPGTYPGLAEKLLWKSASVTGFFLLRHAHLLKPHLAKLIQLHAQGTLQVPIDPRSFVGLEDVADAVEHLHSGRSIGKVVVQLPKQLPPPQASSSSQRSRL